MVASTSEHGPARYYVYDRAKKKASSCSRDRTELEKQPLVKMHPVVIKARDGLDLVSYLTLPPGRPDGDGKPNSRADGAARPRRPVGARQLGLQRRTHQLLANRGYAVLQRQLPRLDRLRQEVPQRRQPRVGRQDARRPASTPSSGRSKAGDRRRRRRSASCGGSYGGYATLVGLTFTPDVFACGVDIVGPSNLVTLLEHDPAVLGSRSSQLFQRRASAIHDGRGQEVPRRALAAVPRRTRSSRPLLIGQGANDPRVKQAESDQIVEAMQEHGIPVDYVLFPDEGHGFAAAGEPPAVLRRRRGVPGEAPRRPRTSRVTQDEMKASSMQIKDGRNGIPGL